MTDMTAMTDTQAPISTCDAGKDTTLAGNTRDQALAELDRADQARYRAMLDGDVDVLDGLLHDALSYTHSSALQEGKAAYLASLRSGRVRYLDAEVQEVFRALHGEVAVMQGKARLRAVVDGVERTLDNRFLSVWKRDGGNWRMLAWASTPIPPLAGIATE